MFVAIFLSLSILLFYASIKMNGNSCQQKILKGPINVRSGTHRLRSQTEPNRHSTYLQVTNNYPHYHKCKANQPNSELCSEFESNSIGTNFHYIKEPQVMYPLSQPVSNDLLEN